MCDTPENPIYIRCDDEEEGLAALNRRKRAAADMFRKPLAAIHADRIKAMERVIAWEKLMAEDVSMHRDDGGIYLSPGPKVQVIMRIVTCFLLNVSQRKYTTIK